jgi:hypothetical protein
MNVRFLQQHLLIEKELHVFDRTSMSGLVVIPDAVTAPSVLI